MTILGPFQRLLASAFYLLRLETLGEDWSVLLARAGRAWVCELRNESGWTSRGEGRQAWQAVREAFTGQKADAPLEVDQAGLVENARLFDEQVTAENQAELEQLQTADVEDAEALAAANARGFRTGEPLPQFGGQRELERQAELQRQAELEDRASAPEVFPGELERQAELERTELERQDLLDAGDRDELERERSREAAETTEPNS